MSADIKIPNVEPMQIELLGARAVSWFRVYMRFPGADIAKEIVRDWQRQHGRAGRHERVGLRIGGVVGFDFLCEDEQTASEMAADIISAWRRQKLIVTIDSQPGRPFSFREALARAVEVAKEEKEETDGTGTL